MTSSDNHFQTEKNIQANIGKFLTFIIIIYIIESVQINLNK